MASDETKPEGARVEVYFNADFYEEIPSLEYAMQLTVTPEKGMTSAERWRLETPYLTEEIGKFLPLGPETRLLDYGCGTGRMSKALIDRYGCRAFGLDASKAMRLLAPEHVLSERFTTWSPEVLDKMIDQGFRVDHCICLWVIQHAFDPMEVILRIDRALRPGGLLYVLNGRFRCVPTNEGYSNDGFDAIAALRSVFSEEHESTMPPSIVPEAMAPNAVVQVLRKVASA